MERLKKELFEKARMVEDKNQEILKLRIEIEDLRANVSGGAVSEELLLQRKNILYDLGIALGKLRSELSKSKALLCKDPH